MRSAHVVKGAAANLMCEQLRQASLNLEQAARQAHEAGGTAASQDVQALVQTRHGEIQQAAQNFFTFLQSIGV